MPKQIRRQGRRRSTNKHLWVYSTGILMRARASAVPPSHKTKMGPQTPVIQMGRKINIYHTDHCWCKKSTHVILFVDDRVRCVALELEEVARPARERSTPARSRLDVETDVVVRSDDNRPVLQNHRCGVCPMVGVSRLATTEDARIVGISGELCLGRSKVRLGWSSSGIAQTRPSLAAERCGLTAVMLGWHADRADCVQ